MAEVFALCDANNFYVSCERVFNAKLVQRPVVVLSLSKALACKSLKTNTSHFFSILTAKRVQAVHHKPVVERTSYPGATTICRKRAI